MKKTLFAVYEAKHCRIVMPTTTQPEPSIIFHMVPEKGFVNSALAKLDPTINLARLTKEMLLVHTDKVTFTYPCDFDWVPENHRISNWTELMEARVKLRKAMKKLEEIKLNRDPLSKGCTDQQYVKHGTAGAVDNTLSNLVLLSDNPSTVFTGDNYSQRDSCVATDTKVCTDSATSGNYSSDCSCSSGE